MQQTEGFYFPPVKSSLHHNVVCATYISFNLFQYLIYLQHRAYHTLLDCQKLLTKKGKHLTKIFSPFLKDTVRLIFDKWKMVLFGFPFIFFEKSQPVAVPRGHAGSTNESQWKTATSHLRKIFFSKVVLVGNGNNKPFMFYQSGSC